MKIDLTEHEYDSLMATLIGTIAEYENREKNNSVLDGVMEDLNSILGKMYAKQMSGLVEKFYFGGSVRIKDKENFKKFIKDITEELDELS